MVTASTFIIQNQKNGYQTTIDGATTIDLFFEVDPRWRTNIHVKKNGGIATVDVSMQTREPGTVDTIDQGQRLADLETAIFDSKSTGTTDYQAGGDTGISIVKVAAAASGQTTEITITQFKDN